MSLIKIETLTCLHIGSGNLLQNGNDFVKGDYDGESCLGIIDPSKVLNIIGEKNINRWETGIENKESTDNIVKQYAPQATMDDYSKRILLDWASVKDNETLKELIHDGNGRPYIPGSSIKGAIRTAVLSSLVTPNYEHLINRNRVTAKNIEDRLFGNSPNTDVFRFLQVGDAYFGNNYEVAVRMVNINERERQSFWDESKPQVIEALPPEDTSTFSLRIKKSTDRNIRIPECMKDINQLFDTINTHTLRLLNEEIEYWSEKTNKDNSDSVHEYIQKIKTIQSTAESCKSGYECVLRIGHGSGWRFITGAWSEEFSCFNSVIVPASRPKNDNYRAYDFPKTRRVDDECELLGFVKLSIIR